MEQDKDAKDKKRPKRSRARRVGRATVLGTAVMSLLGGLAVMLIIGQTMTAPDWLRDRIATRIERNLGGAQISFGDVKMVINKGWRPRVRLQDVVLTGADGAEIVHLVDAEASMAMRPLLRGRIQPKEIALRGAYATLRRDAEGAVSLSLGNRGQSVGQARGFAELAKQSDAILQSPIFGALRTVQLEALTLRYEDARANRGWTVDGGQVLITRSGMQLRGSASFALLGGGDAVSTLEMNYSSRIGTPSADFGLAVGDVRAQDLATFNTAFGWLGVLRAPISGAIRGSLDAAGSLGPISATLQIGAGALQPTNETKPIPFTNARCYVTYSPAEQVMVFDELSLNSDWVSGVAEGRAYLDGLETGRLTDLIGQVSLTDLSFNPRGLYETAPRIDGAAADFRLELAPFRLRLGQMQIHDRDTTLHLDGELGAGPDGWQVALNGLMDEMTPKRLVALWPEAAAPNPRSWVAQNLRGGALRDVHFALRSKPGRKPDVYVDFDYADAEIKALKTMPPITGASGQASLDRNRFVTTATSGRIKADEGGYLDVSGTSFIIPDVTIPRAAPGIVRVAGRGSVTAILSLLDRPPLSVLKDTELPVSLADGSASLTGTFALPLRDGVPPEEITYHLSGAIRNMRSEVLVPGQVLAAPELDVNVDQTRVILSGAGRIGDLPVDMRWRQPIGKDGPPGSTINGTVELSQRLIDTFNIGLPPDSVSGTGTADVTVALGAGAAPALTMTSNLSGVGLAIPALSWRKPPGGTGRFSLSATLGARPAVSDLRLEANGLTAQGAVTVRPDGGLDRVRLSSVKLNDWLDARVEIVGRGPGAAPELRVLTGRLDMRRATFGSGQGGGETGPITLVLDRLQVTDTIALTGFVGDFTTTQGLTGSFKGQVNGQAQVTGRISPRQSRSAVRILSNDAGGVFRSAGVLRQGRGGRLVLTLLPVGATGQFEGVLRVTNTQVQDAPAIAGLLNAISVVGLLDEVSGQGIQFTEVDAQFGLSPSRLTIYESSAVGPSIGLSMDGTLDVATGRLNMQGVISPVYLLNQIGALLTRKGEGVIGFNYTLTGAANAPQVSVNPLSALAPGMLRDIFRDPAPVRTQAPEAVPVPIEPADPPGRGEGAGRGGDR